MHACSAFRRSFRPVVEALESRALLSICLVDRLTDTGAGSGLAGDLRYCLTQAQNGDTIQLGVTGTIGLSRGQLFVIANVSLEGPGASRLGVRATLNNRVFTVAAGVTASFSGLTVFGGGDTNIFNSGRVTIRDSVISDAFVGSGVYNQGRMTLRNCVLRNNISNPRGGGINNNGTLELTDSTVLGNRSSQGDGGGIANSGTMTVANTFISVSDSVGPGGGIANSGTLLVTGSTIAGNRGGGAGGGGIANTGSLTIRDSAIWGNAAPTGGGIYHAGNGSALTISNVTISGNISGPPVGENALGGGIHARDANTVTISHTTITGNEAQNASGGGIRVQGTTVRLWNTIVAGNTARTGPDYSGAVTSRGYNLIGNSNGGTGFVATDLLNVNPVLGPLQDNGGPTFTHALLPGSPALNAADPAAGNTLTFPKWDQRGSGFWRIAGGRLDIGAFEVQGRRDSRAGESESNGPRPGFDVAALLIGSALRRRAGSVTTVVVGWEQLGNTDEVMV